MYNCHMCDLETKQLNGLMSRHWKTHCSELYSKEQYKSDLLKHNGRQLNNCLVCSLEVPIPKGEKESPKYHKKCYLSQISGSANPNYRGGKAKYQCRACLKEIEKHSTQILVKTPFCSTSCSMNFYAEPENRTEKQKANDIAAANLLRAQNGTDKQRKAHAESLVKLQTDRSSSIELEMIDKLRPSYPAIQHQVIKDFYTVDIYIPEINVYLDVHGNYWHNRPDNHIQSKRKRKFLEGKGLEYLEIWQNEMDLQDPVAWARKQIDVTILCGPPGVGKSWAARALSNKYTIVDYDKIGYDECLTLAQENTNVLVVTPIRATAMLQHLRDVGVRGRIIVIEEDASIVDSRLKLRGGELTESVLSRIKRYRAIASKQAQFVGTQAEVVEYLSASQSA